MRDVMMPIVSRRCRTKAHGGEVVLLEISISDTERVCVREGEREIDSKYALPTTRTTCLRFAAIKRYRGDHRSLPSSRNK